MIAEIKNKAPRDYVGKEDVLTGNFFGALRYTKFQDFLGECLLSAASFNYPKDYERFKEILKSIDNETFNENIKFWPKIKNDEIDLIIEFDKVVIGIEVKFHSGLSSDDEIYNNVGANEDRSKNQLSRYADLLIENYNDKEIVSLVGEDTID